MCQNTHSTNLASYLLLCLHFTRTQSTKTSDSAAPSGRTASHSLSQQTKASWLYSFVKYYDVSIFLFFCLYSNNRPSFTMICQQPFLAWVRFHFTILLDLHAHGMPTTTSSFYSMHYIFYSSIYFPILWLLNNGFSLLLLLILDNQPLLLLLLGGWLIGFWLLLCYFLHERFGTYSIQVQDQVTKNDNQGTSKKTNKQDSGNHGCGSWRRLCPRSWTRPGSA